MAVRLHVTLSSFCSFREIRKSKNSNRNLRGVRRAALCSSSIHAGTRYVWCCPPFNHHDHFLHHHKLIQTHSSYRLSSFWIHPHHTCTIMFHHVARRLACNSSAMRNISKFTTSNTRTTLLCSSFTTQASMSQTGNTSVSPCSALPSLQSMPSNSRCVLSSRFHFYFLFSLFYFLCLL